jgi:hypothetical protein
LADAAGRPAECRARAWKIPLEFPKFRDFLGAKAAAFKRF